MKAFGYTINGGPEVQEFLELEQPVPLAGELLVEVRAAGVNPVDWKVRSGAYGPANASDLPAVLGFEVAGVVRAAGIDVDGFSVGDEVFGAVAPGSGGYAEYALVTAKSAAAIPPQVSFTDAATLTVAAATAYDGVTQLNLKAGQTLLINGVGGGVGVAAAQIARDLDLFVIGTASEDKRPLVESLDATLITYGDGVVDRIRQILPDGVDAIFDLVGGDGAARRGRGVGRPRQACQRGRSRDRGRARGSHDRAGSQRPGAEDSGSPCCRGKAGSARRGRRALDRAAEALAAVEVGHAKGKVVIAVS